MNRREFIGTVATTAVGVSLAKAQESVAGTLSLVRTPLVLMAPRLDGIEAVWAVNQLCKGKLEWKGDDGTSGVAGANGFGFVPQGDNVIRVRIDGLKPGVTYKVRSITTAAGSAGKIETSEWKTFRTLNPAAKTTKFVVWNDTHINNPTIQKLHEVTPSADFLLWNGDTCNDWKTPDILVPTLLHPGERDITQGRPLFLTFGNHDVRGPHAFEMPKLTPTPSGRPFYAFRSGPVAGVCLHTGEDKPDEHPNFQGRVAFDALRREQAEWLAEVIRQPGFRDAPYRIIFCHIPLRWLDESVQDYSKTGFDRHSGRSRDAWHKILVQWKAQLIISGHTHRTAWMEPTEQWPYGQITGGGPQLASATWMLAEASADELSLKVNDLEGKLKQEVKLKPLV